MAVSKLETLSHTSIGWCGFARLPYTDRMKVLLIGATGGTGQLILPLLLEAGHEVTALARKPSAIALRNPKLRIVEGEARDAASIERAVAGQDAVISAFGPRSFGKSDLQETFLRNLVAAMEKQGVKRLVNLSAWGSRESIRHSRLPLKIIRATLLRHVYADKERGEAWVDASPLDYTHVRPGRLLNSKARGGVRASMDGAGMQNKMTRADLAAFMVAQLTDATWSRKGPLIGY